MMNIKKTPPSEGKVVRIPPAEVIGLLDAHDTTAYDRFHGSDVPTHNGRMDHASFRDSLAQHVNYDVAPPISYERKLTQSQQDNRVAWDTVLAITLVRALFDDGNKRVMCNTRTTIGDFLGCNGVSLYDVVNDEQDKIGEIQLGSRTGHIEYYNRFMQEYACLNTGMELADISVNAKFKFIEKTQ